jgi:hypothetical protein
VITDSRRPPQRSITAAEPMLWSSHTTRRRPTPPERAHGNGLAKDLGGVSTPKEPGPHAVADVAARAGQVLGEGEADRDPADDVAVDDGKEEVGVHQALGHPRAVPQAVEQVEVGGPGQVGVPQEQEGEAVELGVGGQALLLIDGRGRPQRQPWR